MLDKPLSSLDERQAQLRQNLRREPYMTGADLGLAGGLIIAPSINLALKLARHFDLNVQALFSLEPFARLDAQALTARLT